MYLHADAMTTTTGCVTSCHATSLSGEVVPTACVGMQPSLATFLDSLTVNVWLCL